jgi:hypothetical protein
MAEPVGSQVGGGLEKIGPQETHGARLVEPQQPHIGFLGNFPGVLLRA